MKDKKKKLWSSKNAVIKCEMKKINKPFINHSGYDLKGIARSCWRMCEVFKFPEVCALCGEMFKSRNGCSSSLLCLSDMSFSHATTAYLHSQT